MRNATNLIMTLLTQLAEYLSGEFDNREQAIAQPVWFVHLRLWQRPVKLFDDDSLTIFAEQSNIVNLDQPYRQRLMRLQRQGEALQVQFYAFQDPSQVKGGGQYPDRLQNLDEQQIEFLPGCVLTVQQDGDRFVATPNSGDRCCFDYQGKTVQVSLGFEVTGDRFFSFDKGIDLETGKGTWGALMGPYEYTKRQPLSYL
jgi:hypothetical protein